MLKTENPTIATAEDGSYRQIMKGTSIFGGVQVLQIIIKIISSKAIALLLGPAGMGISVLLTSTLGLISSLTNFGLGTSAVKNVASANSTGDKHRISTIVIVLKRWVWATGLLGTLLVLFLSPWLSELTFNNREYTSAFIWISVTLLFNQLSSGQNVVLQGLRKLKYLASASVTGSFVGLILSLPLYYFYGIDGIVPVIIVISISNMALSWYFSRKVELKKVEVTKQTTLKEGKDMLKMGIMLSLSGLLATGASYILRIYISNQGGITDVGLYAAGFTIIGTYVGLIFTAMATDYYPRLAAVSKNNETSKKLIGQQAEIAILILAPILCVFLVYINWMVILLYSTKFTPISGMIHWAALGMFFKAASWSIAFIFLAKGAARLFFWNELITNIYLLGLNLIGYKYWGLDGLGISFLISYIIYFLQVYVVARLKYEFTITSEFIKILGAQLILAIGCFLTVKLIDKPYSYFMGSVIIVVSSVYSIYELDKRLNLKSILDKFKNK